MANVYYSVGQNSTDHCTGSGTTKVSISSGVMTFDTAQVATNLGVGDRVTYDTTSICYLVAKTSTTVWTVVDKVGVAPGDVSNKTLNSIAHEYTSISAAEAGSTDANHMNTTNIVTGGFVLYLPCYYDTGAGTTPINFTGITTGASNFIKVYTPYKSNECNQSQRHSGIWTTSKHHLIIPGESGIENTVGHLRIEGMQIQLMSAVGSYESAILFNGSGTVGHRVSHCILKGVASDYEFHCGIDIRSSTSVDGTLLAWNNIIYGYMGSGPVDPYNCFGINQSGTAIGVNIYAFNNTLYGCNAGLSSGSSASPEVATFHAFNNIIQNSQRGTDYDYQYYSADSDYNVVGLSQSSPNPSAVHNKYNSAVTFIDSGNSDFHLSIFDNQAKGAGANLYADANCPVVDDIDMQARSSVMAFDVGADQTSHISDLEVTPPPINSAVASVITMPIAIATLDDAYFDANAKFYRIDIYYEHEDGIQKKKIQHYFNGNFFIGYGTWHTYAKTGVWKKTFIKAWDTDGARKKAPIIGEDFTLS